MTKLITIDSVGFLGKQELHAKGGEAARTLMEEGFTDALNLVAMARKASEYMGAFIKELDSDARAEVNLNGGDKETLGAKFSIGSTGDRIDFEVDPIYKAMKAELKARELLLKTAKTMDNPIYDAGGIEVPRLPLKSASREVLKIRL